MIWSVVANLSALVTLRSLVTRYPKRDEFLVRFLESGVQTYEMIYIYIYMNI